MSDERIHPTVLKYSDGLDAGMTRRQIDDAALARPHRGVRSDVEPVDYRERAESLSAVFREADFFSHITAAVFWGLPVPTPRFGDRLHVSVRPPSRAMRRVGVNSHHLWDEKVRIEVVGGMPLADPLSTFCHLGELLSMEDLVAVGDAIVLRPRYPRDDDPRPFGTVEALIERASYFRGRGGRKVREAASLVRIGAESRMESLLRLLLIQRGLPEPSLNVELFTSAGTFVARVDMEYEEYGVVVEYDGDHHRTDKAQNEKDITRLEAIQALGLTVIRVRDAGLFSKPDDTVRRVESALLQSGWRP